MRGLLDVPRVADADAFARIHRRHQLRRTNLAVAERAHRGVHHRRIVAGVVDQPGRRGIRKRIGRDQVAPAQFMRLDIQHVREFVQRAFHREAGGRAADAAIRPGRRLVRAGTHRGRTIVADAIGPGHDVGRHVRLDRAGRGQHRIRPAIDEVLGFKCDDLAVAVRVDGHRLVVLARMAGRQQVLHPVLDPAHRRAEPDRDRGHRQLFWIQVGLHAERAADIGHHHLDAMLVDADQLLGQEIALDVRPLTAGVEQQAPLRTIEHCQAAARLERRRRQPLHPVEPGQMHLGARHRGIELAEGARELHEVVARPAFVHQRCARFECGTRGRNHRQRLDVDFDLFNEVFRTRPARRHHRRDRLPDEAHPVGRQARIGRSLEPRTVELRDDRPRDILQVGSRPERFTRRGHRRTHRADHAMRDGAAHEREVQPTGPRDVGDEAACTVQVAFVFRA